MRFLRVSVAALLILTLSLCCIAYAADDIVIDVQDGYLKTGNYNIKMSGDATPISITLVDGDVILVVQTETGDSMRLNLGPGRIALTKRANSFVAIEQGAPAAGSETGTGAVGECPQCGKPLAVGDHSKLACGHYACTSHGTHGHCQYCGGYYCAGGTHAPCPICGKGLCTHSKDDPYRTCYYLDNPAPTPFQTTDPDGRIVYFYISPDGAFFMGHPSGEKQPIWAPGVKYVDAFNKLHQPTPSPTPGFCAHCGKAMNGSNYDQHNVKITPCGLHYTCEATAHSSIHRDLCTNPGCGLYHCDEKTIQPCKGTNPNPALQGQHAFPPIVP